MAGTTGLEPAASAVTGQRSNQLNYVPAVGKRNALKIAGFQPSRSRNCWSEKRGLRCKTFAKTPGAAHREQAMVGSAGLEPATSCL